MMQLSRFVDSSLRARLDGHLFLCNFFLIFIALLSVLPESSRAISMLLSNQLARSSLFQVEFYAVQNLRAKHLCENPNL